MSIQWIFEGLCEYFVVEICKEKKYLLLLQTIVDCSFPVIRWKGMQQIDEEDSLLSFTKKNGEF